MRPLSLTMQAFGSYAGRVEVDFVALARHGVFSITGPTGAGKTTIFDAMVYALYGELPGKREPSGVRSHFAKDSLETKVTFAFEARGETWEIERRPTQLRPKARGTGMTEDKGSMLLRQLEDATSGGFTRKSDVAERIAELVGLDAKQFQQVILLPQGEFEKVLKADTNERGELLKKLFPVALFERFTDELKDEASRRQAIVAQATQQVSNHVELMRSSFERAAEVLGPVADLAMDAESLAPDAFRASSVEPFLAELDRAEAQLDQKVEGAQKIAVAAGRAFDNAMESVEAFDAFQQLLVEEAAAPARIEAENEQRERIRRADIANPASSSLELFRTSTKSIEEAATGEAEARRELQQYWPAQVPAVEIVDYRAAEALCNQLPVERTSWLEASERQQGILGRRKQLGDAEELLREEENALARRSEELGKAQQGNEVMQGRLKELRKLSQPYAKQEQAVEALRLELERAMDAAEAAKKLNVAKREAAKAERAEAEAASKLEVLLAARHAEMAASLAENLVAGDPCPTCGSTAHPKLAKRSKASASSAEIEEAEAATLQATKVHRKADKAVSHLEGVLAALSGVRQAAVVKAELKVAEGALKELQALVIDQEQLEDDLEGRQAWAAGEAKELEAESKAFERKVKDHEVAAVSLRGDLQAFEQRFGSVDSFIFVVGDFDYFTALASKLRDTLEQLERAQADQASSLAGLRPALEELGLTSPEELIACFLPKAEREELEAAIQQSAAQRSAVATRLADLRRRGVPEQRPEITALQAAKEQADDELAHLKAASTAVSLYRAQVVDAQRELGDSTKELELARAAAEQANTLARIAAGQTAGSTDMRVSLEDWVLSDYLKLVLLQANERLTKMTDGRYELQVNSSGGDGRGRHGLDLEVFDAATGKARMARTLSGGETFKAALALALGLADVVSSGKNRDLGALFIDEGFGSLDANSLDSVIGVLDSLQELGGRMVGVISHVEELKVTIPQGIEVTTSDRGSELKVHYPE